MKVAYLSPLPPVRSGVSEYSADLLPHLARLVPLRVFGAPPAAGKIGDLQVEHPDVYDAEEFDLSVYNMGNNVHHRFVGARARARPGLLVLHDVVLHHFYVEETLALGNTSEYVRLMEETYGDVGRNAGLARAHEVDGPMSYFVFPLFETLVARSRGVIVHNHRAAGLVRDRVADVPVHVVSMGIPDVSRDPLPERAEARQGWGITPEEFVVGLFGFMTPIKRPLEALRAFAAASARIPSARLVVVGEVAARIDIAGEARALGIADRVVLTGYIPYEDVKRWAAATDVFLNLRYPTAGETSASLLRLLGWGKPVIVSDYAQFREIPEEAAVRVSLGSSEEAELEEILVLLSGRAALRERLGRQAAAYVRRAHRLEDAAASYSDFIRELLERGPYRPAGRIRPLLKSRTSRTPRYPKARIEAAPLPARVPPGARLTLRARLTNTGDTTWLRWWSSEDGYAGFGVQVRLPNGQLLDEVGPSALPRDVAPGQSADVSCTFDVPDVEGGIEVVGKLMISPWGRLRQVGHDAVSYMITVTGGEGAALRPAPEPLPGHREAAGAALE